MFNSVDTNMNVRGSAFVYYGKKGVFKEFINRPKAFREASLSTREIFNQPDSA